MLTFKCHVCGFSSGAQNDLVDHYDQQHPEDSPTLTADLLTFNPQVYIDYMGRRVIHDNHTGMSAYWKDLVGCFGWQEATQAYGMKVLWRIHSAHGLQILHYGTEPDESEFNRQVYQI